MSAMLTRFCATNFLKHQRYFTPIVVLYMLSKGLSFSEVFSVFTAEALVIMLFEVPTGVLADVWSKRGANIIAPLLLIPGLVLYCFADGLWGFIAAQCVIGLADAFKSGTFKAYMHDYLEYNGNRADADYTEWIGKAKFWSRIGEAVAAVGGCIVAVLVGYKWCFYLSVIPAVLNVFNAWTFPVLPNPNKLAGSGMTMMAKATRQTRDGVMAVLRDRYLVVLIVNSGILMFLFKGTGLLYQPYMNDAGIPVLWFGVIYTVGNLLSAMASRYAKVAESRWNRVKALNVLSWWHVLPLGLLALGLRPWETWHCLVEFMNNPARCSAHTGAFVGGVIMFMMVYGLKSMRNPIALHELNSQVEKSFKATVLSIDVMARSVFCFLFLPIVGWIMDKASFQWVMVLFVTIAVMNQVLFRIRESWRSRPVNGGKS